MPVLSISNQKGGAGKTTLAMVLADQLATTGLRVGVVDADPNAIIAKWAKRRADAGKDMPYEVVAKPTESEMISTIERLGEENDFVIIDLEGSASRMMSRAMARSHLVLIPFNQSPIDAELAANAVSLIHEEGEALQRRIPYRLVRSRTNAAVATKTSRRIASAIEDAEIPLLRSGLVERAAYRDIYEFGALLSELDPATTSGLERARENARELAQDVLNAIAEEYPQ